MHIIKVVFSLFLHVFCVITYFYCIFVPRLSPASSMGDKKLSPEKGHIQ